MVLEVVKSDIFRLICDKLTCARRVGTFVDYVTKNNSIIYPEACSLAVPRLDLYDKKFKKRNKLFNVFVDNI